MSLPYDLLLRLGKITQPKVFTPIHSLARRIYLGPLTAIAEFYLRRLTKNKYLKLISRHSVRGSKDFNIFFSDVDFSLTCAEVTFQDADEISRAYGHLKLIFPMLGELEIFTPPEWARVKELHREHGPLLQLIRDLKKIRWMEWAFTKNSHPYHKYKSRRAISRIIKEYEGKHVPFESIGETGNHRFLGSGLTKRLRALVHADKIEALRSKFPDSLVMHARELDVKMSYGDLPDSDLVLEPWAILCLLALFPNHYDDSPDVESIRQLVREIPEVRALHLAAIEYEFIYASASPRMNPQWRGVSDGWIQKLKEQSLR